MGNLWWLLLVGLATGSISERIFVSSQSFSTTDDLYIEGQISGDLPIDDEDGEDGGSGSGSGDTAFPFREVFPSKPTTHSPLNPPTTAARSQDPATAVKDTQTTRFIFPDGDNKDEVPGVGPSTTNNPLSGTTAADDGVMDSNHDRSQNGVTLVYEDTINKSSDKGRARAGPGGRLLEENSSLGISSENLLERKEVLAAVIACGVVGFLCAVFLLALLAYRMKKKDEGSYDLGDNKHSVTAYHKAPTKEFYA